MSFDVGEEVGESVECTITGDADGAAEKSSVVLSFPPKNNVGVIDGERVATRSVKVPFLVNRWSQDQNRWRLQNPQ